MTKPKARRAFTLQFKLAVIHAYEQSKSLHATAKTYKIQRAVIRRWIKNKNKLLNSKSISKLNRYLLSLIFS
jgi:transposase-like protein